MVYIDNIQNEIHRSLSILRTYLYREIDLNAELTHESLLFNIGLIYLRSQSAQLIL